MSDEAMPHMSVREGKICGVPTRLFRMSFTGDRGFEVNVPADYGKAVWEALWAEGQKHGACAYGTEAMHVLRAEKGYIIVGQDTDGTVTPNDAALDWAVGKKKTDFVGIRGLMRPDLVAAGRRQLVGLKAKDPKIVLEEGAQIVADPKQPIPMKMIGHVTSSYWSENCGRGIALGLVEGGRDMMGQTLYVPMPDRVHRGGSVRHGVLRREGRAPQWLRLHQPLPHEMRRLPAKNSSASGVTLSVLPPAERISLRAPAASVAALSKALGVDLPQKPKTFCREGWPHGAVARSRRVACHRRSRQGSAGRLRGGEGAAFGRRHLAPQCRHRSHRSRPPLSRSTPAVRRICRSPPFPVGACSRTILGKIEIVLLRTAEDSFRVECWRSFSDYAWTFLTEAARDAAA